MAFGNVRARSSLSSASSFSVEPAGCFGSADARKLSRARRARGGRRRVTHLYRSPGVCCAGDRASLVEHLHRAVERHEAGFHPKLRVPLGDLLAKFAECRSMRLGFGLGRCDLGLAVGDPGGTAIAVIDRYLFLDSVQLNRRTEIVPERLMPVLKGGSDDADGRTGDDELTVFAGQISPSKIFPHGLLYARIDASQHHGFVIAFGCNHK